MAIENITNPGAEPADGDWIRVTHSNGGTTEKQFHVHPEPSAEEIAHGARGWRDGELESTDWIAQTPDHPQRDDYLAYRVKLRDWPTTSDFPDTKPTAPE